MMNVLKKSLCIKSIYHFNAGRSIKRSYGAKGCRYMERIVTRGVTWCCDSISKYPVTFPRRQPNRFAKSCRRPTPTEIDKNEIRKRCRAATPIEAIFGLATACRSFLTDLTFFPGQMSFK